MFTFFKRSSSKHKCEDSRSASATPPPCSSRVPSSLLTKAAGDGGSGERKVSKNKRVRFKFVSDHEEDESKRQQRFEESVSAKVSNQLHGNTGDEHNQRTWETDSYRTDKELETEDRERSFNSFDYGERSQDYAGEEVDVEEEEEENRPKARSALNQLLERMGGKKNRHRGGNSGSGGGGHSKKAKHPNGPIFNVGPKSNQNVVGEVKKCDQDDYNDRDGSVKREYATFGPSSKETHFYGKMDARDTREAEEVATSTTAANFNARGDRHENRPEILHKIDSRQKSNDENDYDGAAEQTASWFSRDIRSESIERPSFRLFVNEQPAEESRSSLPPENPAADFVRDLVLNRYKKKRERPVNRRVDSDAIPTVIFDEHIVPVVVEKSDDEAEEERVKMGQPNSKANSPNPLERSSSDGSIHPTVIITEEEVFYEADGGVVEPQFVEDDATAEDEDDGILREHSPLRLSPAFKTIHVSTEDLQDEPEQGDSGAEEEDFEETDSENFNSSCYNNTIKNKSGVTVVEIVDENNNEGDNGLFSIAEEDSGCEEALRLSASPQRHPLPVPVVVVANNNGATSRSGVTSDDEEDDNSDTVTDEELDDDECENRVIKSILKNRKIEPECVSLPDVVESIGLPNVVHVMHSANSVRFNNDHQSEPTTTVGDKKMANQNGAQGILHVDGNSHKSVLVRNIPITILEEASEEEQDDENGVEEEDEDEEEEESEVDVIKGTTTVPKIVNGRFSDHSNQNGYHEPEQNSYKKCNGFSIEEQRRDMDTDCDKRDLVNQDALQSKGRVAELEAKLDELERNLTVKVWTIDRLEAELASATKEGECVRRKLKNQEEEMAKCRHRFEDNEDDLNRRYQDLEEKLNETHEKLVNIQTFTRHLQVQLAEAQSDAESSRLEKEQLIQARTEEEKIIRDTLEQAIEDRNQAEAKWQNEFEKLRSFNQDREETLMEDLEWKMRSMQKQCKEKIDKAELQKREALKRAEEMEDITKVQEERIESLQSYESEVTALRGLTGEQRENLTHIMRQLEEVKEELTEANQQATIEIRNAQKIKTQCENEVLAKERYALIAIEEAKMQISVQWERKLLEEMVRLKCELEAVHGEDRKESLEKLTNEYTTEINRLVTENKSLEEELSEEIGRLRDILESKREELLKQVVDTRIYIDRSDRTNQMMLDRVEKDRETDREEMEKQFRERLQSVKDEFAHELVESTKEVEEKYKRLLETQIDSFIAEKEEMLQEAETRHRHKIKTLEEQMRDLEIQFQREKSDYERNHGIERTALEKREMQNSQEIDTLHRKCRCLTKLFEEMRMRYERRESRQEDQREISELKERCEAQERDLMRLTETLRQLQIIQEHQHPIQADAQMPVDVPPVAARAKGRGLANPSHNCDVIYEEQEPQEEEQNEEEEEEDEVSAVTTIDEDSESVSGLEVQ